MNNTITVETYDFTQLMKEHDQNLKLIDRIKNRVSKTNDIENTIPLFEQLENNPS